MNIVDIKEELKEMRRLRGIATVKIHNYGKRGKDTSVFEKQLQGYKSRIEELTRMEKDTKQVILTKKQPNTTKTLVVPVPPRGEVAVLKKSKQSKPVQVARKTWKKDELTTCQKAMNKILDDNDWRKGYQFRSSECMYITHLRTVVLPDSVELEYTIQYKTKAHRVENTITKFFTPDTVQSLNKYIEKMELWVMLNSGDLDNKDIVFGTRFNKVQFDIQGMASKGWIIRK